MTTLRTFLNRAVMLFRRSAIEAALADEIRSHLDMQADEHRRRGMTADQARHAALRDFGGVDQIKERYRDRYRFVLLESLVQDLRYGARALRKNPGFTTIGILTLALGIGANTAIFSLINVLMLRTLPVRQPEQLVELLTRHPGEPRVNGYAWKYYEHYRDHNHVFSDLIGVAPSRFQVSAEGIDPEALDGEYVTANFFGVLGVKPAIGRLIDPQDDQLGAGNPAVAVLSWSCWQNRFNGDPAIVGRGIAVDGVAATVIGVTPGPFFGLQVGARPDIWLPVGMESLTQRSSHRADGTLGVKLMGRLKPGVNIEQARAEMRVLDRARIEEIATVSKNSLWRQARIEVEPAAAGFAVLRDNFAKPLLVLMAIVGLLLLIACTNVASMLLARGAARQREMAVRVALGAGRSRLVRQVLTESLLLSATGSFLGVVLAYVGADAVLRIMTSGLRIIGLPQRVDIQLQPDARVLLFTTGLAMVTGVLFGLAPAWNSFVSAPASLLREIGGSGETRSRRLFGKSLVVAQVALSVVLLSAAGLFVRHLTNLRSVNLGFRRDSLLLVRLDPARSGYQANQLAPLYQELLGRLEAIPGVRSATLSGATPIEGAGAARFANVEGFQEKPEDRRYLSLNWVAPKYFETLGTPLVAGRDFRFDDEGRPRVAVVNLAMARHYFGEGSAIGKHFTFDGQDTPYEIVGVVGDAKYLNLHNAPPRTIYLNAFQEGRGRFSQFCILTSAAPTGIANDVRRTVRDVLKTVSITKVTTMADQMDASIVPERLVSTLSGLFGALGAALAAIGLYGLLAYTVARRVNEIGIRMALGATEGHVTRMVLNGALELVSLGLAIGVPVAMSCRALAANVVENLSVDIAFPTVFAVVTLIGVASLAAYVPARRAARVHPIEALRHS